MKITLATVNLEVADLARSRQFYVTTLGLAEHPDRSQPPHFLYLRCAGADVTVQQRRGPGVAPGSVRSMEIGFAVEDVAAWHQRLEAAGVHVQPQTMGWGDALELADPDGHRVILYRLRERA